MANSDDSDETEYSADEIHDPSFTNIVDSNLFGRGAQNETKCNRFKSLVSVMAPAKETYLLPAPGKVWSKGDFCMAPFSGNNEYYKGVIKKIYRQFNQFQAQVSYIGYGSQEDEVVPVSSLRLESCGIESGESSKVSVAEVPAAQSDLVHCSLLEKEKDSYMRQKYESSEDEAKVLIATKSEKKLKKPIINKYGNFNERKSHFPTRKINSSNVLTGFNNSFKVAEDFTKDGQFSWGFTSADLEKPHFTIEPVADKIPFCISKKFSKPVYNIPASINQYLRDYQRDGVCFMYNHLLLEQGCILGDDMGLGKTVQVISLIAALFGKTGNEEDTAPSYLKTSQKKEEEKQRKGPFLIISPSSVLFNWEDELSSWGYFRTGKYHGTAKKETLQKAKKGKLEVVLTTYETFRIHIDAINEVEWFCVIMDEAHKVKEPDSQVTKAAKSISCLRRVGLTGTPMQNNMEELCFFVMQKDGPLKVSYAEWATVCRCLLDWANPGCLGSIETFRNEFVLPIKLGQRFDATKRELATARKMQQEFGLIKDKWILRRTKLLLVEQLPRKDERAVFAPLTELQIALYEAILDFPASSSVIKSSDPCDCGSKKARISCCYKMTKEEAAHHRKETFHIITLLRKISNHAALLLPYQKASSKQRELALSICKKLFGKFPVLEEVYRDGSFTRVSDARFSGKLKILERLLAAANEGKDKVLIFSTSVQLLNILEAYIISRAYVYRRLDGSTRPDARISIVREFNNNTDVFICLVSTKAGGLGLNFTGANVVIIFDPAWNPSFDAQAEDRAYRIGQRRDVRVYRLIAEGSIEENIYLRQIYKQQLSNIAVHTRNERRLFMGVAGVKSKQGELFGLKNLFVLKKQGSNLTNDLVKRTENIESCVRVENFEPKTDEEVGEPLFQNFSREALEHDDEGETSRNVDGFTASIESFVTDSYDLSSEEDMDEKIGSYESEDDIDSSSFIDSLQDSSTESEPTPESRVFKRTFKGEKSSGRKFTRIRGARRVKIEETSSDEEFANDEKPWRIKRRCLKEEVKSKKESKDPKALKQIDNILEKCGVNYTCTAKEIMSKSLAEEKMTSEAIRDVFWHGMYSQEPAHFIDQSTSEESDDIPCLAKTNAVKTVENVDDIPDPSLLSKRIFERIGSDMFLIGAMPPLLRRQQFPDIARHFGFESSLNFARTLVELTENEVREKLFEFYKASEPCISEASSFQSIYGDRSSRFKRVSKNNVSAGVTLSARHKSTRFKRNMRRDHWIFEPDLELSADVPSENLAGRRDLSSNIEHGARHLFSGVKRNLACNFEKASDTSNTKSKVSRDMQNQSHSFGNSVKSSCLKNLAHHSEHDEEERRKCKEFTGREEVKLEANSCDEEHDKEFLSEKGDDVLHGMMFSPVCSTFSSPSKAKGCIVEKSTISDRLPDDRISSSILDELMDNNVTVELTASKKDESARNFASKSSKDIDFEDGASQQSISALDELMGR